VESGSTLLTALKLVVLPPGGLIFVALAALLMLRRWPGTARLCLTGCWLAFYLLCTYPVASLLARAAGTALPVEESDLRSGQAIVILGGGLRLHAVEYGGDTLGELTLERVRYGARLARAARLPVLVTGGRLGDAQRAEADLMRDALEQEFGVPVRWVENAARNTAENARKSAQVLLPLGIRRVVVVMHGFDVGRAKAEFVDAGFEVIPAPTLLAQPELRRWVDLLPHAGALQLSYYSLYELLAQAVRPLRARA
jgi:uncharacterized SAM-binding protein YcdF (DUF218 family)